MKENSDQMEFDTTPFADLVKWLEVGPKPVFVGFGSMVIKKPQELAELIKKAAELADCRVVVQSSWSKLDVSGDNDDGAPARCQNVGPW